MKMITPFIILLAALGLFPLAQAEPIAIIVHPSNPVDTLSWGELARIYKGRDKKWSTGKPIVATNRPTDTGIRKHFYAHVLKAKPTQQFRPPGTPLPFKTRRLKSGEATRKFVARIPNAIGYIHVSDVDKTVKVLKMGGYRPAETEYELK